MKTKNIVYIILLVVLVILAIWYLFVFNRPTNPPINTQQANDKIAAEKRMPKFVLGSVSKTEGQSIYIKVGIEEKTIIINEDTPIIKQTKDGISYRNVEADFGEIKSPVQVVVYYSEGSDPEYRADKVQILDF